MYFKNKYQETFSYVQASDALLLEVLNMKKMRNRSGFTRMTRIMLIAAVLVSMFAMTAFAYAGFVRYENPKEMLDAFFGENGYAHVESETISFQDGTGSFTTPVSDRVPVNYELADELVAPYICAVGQAVKVNDNTLTVHAYLYDSVSKCGLVYMTFENPNGVEGYKLQADGEVWWPAGTKFDSNYMGESYIIPSQTTENQLSVAHYFIFDEDLGKTLQLQINDYVGMDDRDRELMGVSDILEIKFEDGGGMKHLSLAADNIIISPIGIIVYGDGLGIVNEAFETSVESIVIKYADGTEYLVEDDNTYNYAEAVSARNERSYVTYSLNRIVDVENVVSVVINGTEYLVE